MFTQNVALQGNREIPVRIDRYRQLARGHEHGRQPELRRDRHREAHKGGSVLHRGERTVRIARLHNGAAVPRGDGLSVAGFVNVKSATPLTRTAMTPSGALTPFSNVLTTR
jgi:hypothetical protein